MAWDDAPPTKQELATSSSDWASMPPTSAELSGPANPLVSGVRQFVQGASGGFSDEAAGGLEALGRVAGVNGLGGPMKDISADSDPTLDWETLKHAYLRARDKERGSLKQDEKDNPATSGIANLAGMVASPINKLVPASFSAAKAGAMLGGIQGLGSSDADNVADISKDALAGSVFGGITGKGIDVASPYLSKAAGAIGSKAGDIAEKLAYMGSSPALKDVRNAEAKGMSNKIGRFILDNGGNKAFGTVKDMAKWAADKKGAAGDALDDVYNEASDKFGPELNKVGFDPMRDKESIMSAARKELGQSEGASGALDKLSTYLDEVASRHGDKPNEQAQAAFQNEVSDYLPKFKQFLKDRSSFRQSLGSAADDAAQPVLPGLVDDLQRTSSAPTSVELGGKPADIARPELAQYTQQPELPELPQRPEGIFNQPKGADLLPMQQQMALEDMARQVVPNQSTQSSIEGLGLTPKSFAQGELPSIGGDLGQTKMAFAPEQPVRPIRPDEIRNPMDPRAANEVKTAMDQVIDYSRNPLAKDPVKEQAFSAARKALSQKVDDGIESLGGDELLGRLKDANKDYGMASTVARTTGDRVNRNAANKLFGLTDSIAGAGALGYGAATGDWKGAGGIVLAKKGFEKYGAQTGAAMAEKISQALMKSPQMAAVYAKNPAAFEGMVHQLQQRVMGGVEQALPMAADKGDDSAKNFNESFGNQAIAQKTQGTKYAQVMQNAQQRGPQGVAATHFILSQTDPNYRKLTYGDEDHGGQ